MHKGVKRKLDRIEKLFKTRGVLDSVIFYTRIDKVEDHLNLYKEIDIALDTFPYNGVTTSFEAIWMGIPLLTLKGFNPTSRAGESINKNLNMNYLIADNKNEYVQKASDLASNFQKVIEIRKNLFDKALESNLFNVKKFSKEFYENLETFGILRNTLNLKTRKLKLIYKFYKEVDNKRSSLDYDIDGLVVKLNNYSKTQKHE